LDECPVSAITAHSRFLIQQDTMNRHHKEAAGACLFGTNTSDWPALWADAVALIADARLSEHNARFKAETRPR